MIFAGGWRPRASLSKWRRSEKYGAREGFPLIGSRTPAATGFITARSVGISIPTSPLPKSLIITADGMKIQIKGGYGWPIRNGLPPGWNGGATNNTSVGVHCHLKTPRAARLVEVPQRLWSREREAQLLCRKKNGSSSRPIASSSA